MRGMDDDRPAPPADARPDALRPQSRRMFLWGEPGGWLRFILFLLAVAAALAVLLSLLLGVRAILMGAGQE